MTTLLAVAPTTATTDDDATTLPATAHYSLLVHPTHQHDIDCRVALGRQMEQRMRLAGALLAHERTDAQASITYVVEHGVWVFAFVIPFNATDTTHAMQHECATRDDAMQYAASIGYSILLEVVLPVETLPLLSDMPSASSLRRAHQIDHEQDARRAAAKARRERALKSLSPEEAALREAVRASKISARAAKLAAQRAERAAARALADALLDADDIL